MIAALDLDGGAAAELEGAARIAAAFESPLLAVHVIPALALPPWMRGNRAGYNRARVGEAQARLQQLSLPVRRRISGRVLIGDPAESMAALAVEEHAGLADDAGQRPARFPPAAARCDGVPGAVLRPGADPDFAGRVTRPKRRAR